ncbi:bifunctional 3-phenylpropionate/cinnamic acid dioxygenase ferredoxin subunit [Jatrophihabitans sp.]|uniref:bifunctional 3-phenylpropionate/cinnamic acid dioxygenase ferredoxin subunit n=1 Tax=Jatrophihabitans sp. TaxID=1932789 RepID=UPI002F034F01
MIRVCSLAELAPGQIRRLEHQPAIAIFHTEDGELFAVDDTCSHEEASLADGWLEGCVVECPLHAARFDLRTGEPDGPPATEPIRTHGVSIADGDIYVTVSGDAPAAQPGATLPAGP